MASLKRKHPEMDGSDFNRLPEGCISHIFSLTSPRDVCRFSTMSTSFRSASESNDVWERFLPTDYSEIISKSFSMVDFSSKKQLYFRLCDSILVDEGNMSFYLEKSSGKKCYILSARRLAITWVHTSTYWRWISLPESRFSEVAELLNVCWLEIIGRIDSRMLSPKTTYVANLILGLADDNSELDMSSVDLSVKLGAHESTGIACIMPCSSHPEVQIPHARGDGWMGIEMGEFFNDEGNEGEVEMSLKEVRRLWWKKGLIVEGIEVRPRV